MRNSLSLILPFLIALPLASQAAESEPPVVVRPKTPAPAVYRLEAGLRGGNAGGGGEAKFEAAGSAGRLILGGGAWATKDGPKPIVRVHAMFDPGLFQAFDVGTPARTGIGIGVGVRSEADRTKIRMMLGGHYNRKNERGSFAFQMGHSFGTAVNSRTIDGKLPQYFGFGVMEEFEKKLSESLSYGGDWEVMLSGTDNSFGLLGEAGAFARYKVSDRLEVKPNVQLTGALTTGSAGDGLRGGVSAGAAFGGSF